MAIPIDTPIVYDTEERGNEGGSGEDLADQVVKVLKKVLDFNQGDYLCYIRRMRIKLFFISNLSKSINIIDIRYVFHYFASNR